MSAEDHDLMDDYLLGSMNEEEVTVFLARLEIDKELAESFSITKGLYDMLSWKEQLKLFNKLEKGKYKNRSKKNLKLILHFLDEKMQFKEQKRFWKLLQKDKVLAKDFTKQKKHIKFKQQVERLEFMDIAEQAHESYCRKHAEELLELGQDCFEDRKDQWLWTTINCISGIRLRLKNNNNKPGK